MKKSYSVLLVATLMCPLVLSSKQVFADEIQPSNSIVELQKSDEAFAAESGGLSAEDQESTAEESESKSKIIPIQFLGVNDFHGALDTTGSAYLEGGAKFANTGRASVLAAYLDKAQADFITKEPSGITERVQAGDLVGASPANSALLRDEPTMKVFNQMDFSLGTLGNHEFDKGLGEFIRILNGEDPLKEAMGNISDDLWEAINGYPREASKQQIVIANLKIKEDGPEGKAGEQPYDLPPYFIKTYGEGEDTVKVGYIGVVTKEFPSLVLAEHTKNLVVEDEGTAIAEYTKFLREDQKVNAIVVISHVPSTSSNQVVQGEVVDMMSKVDALDPENSVDLVFAGHNHQYTNGVITRDGKNDVRVVQSTSQGKAYIDVQGELDPETQDFKETPNATVTATVGKDAEGKEVIVPNEAIQATVDDASKKIKPITEAAIATADTEKVSTVDGKKMITRTVNNSDESELGNLITDGQLYMANQTDLKDAAGNKVTADFAITNSGGIRADLLVGENGEITWGAAQTVQPFGNILQVVSMSGKDVREAINQQYNNNKSGYSLQLSGLNYTYTGEVKTDTFKAIDITKADGTLLKDDETYNVIINDFLFGGGDGFTAFTKGTLVTAMDTDTETFVNFFKEKAKANEKIVSPEIGRKVIAKAGVTDEELKTATKINQVRKGTKVVSGVTLPETNVGLQIVNGDAVMNQLVVSDDEGEFKFELDNAISEKQIELSFSKDEATYTETVDVYFPEGAYISDGRYVEIAKKNYDLWSNFNWKKLNKSNNIMGEIFQARGRYEHENGSTYLSLYDTKGKWQGYINEKATKTTKNLQGSYISDGRYVTINRVGYSTWSNFDWKERNTTDKLLGTTYQAKGRYKHFNGSTYLSLYDIKGKWQGYVNQNAVKFGTGQQGAYIPNGSYGTIVKDNYKIWSNFNWKKKNTSKKLLNQTYQIKGHYNHINGSTYYSLYNNKGEWQGYINANAVKIGDGKQGAFIADGRKVTIAKKGYSIWSNFKWEERTKTGKVLKVTYIAKGKYNHANGATYLSLYDNKGKWHGYVNQNAVR